MAPRQCCFCAVLSPLLSSKELKNKYKNKVTTAANQNLTDPEIVVGTDPIWINIKKPVKMCFIKSFQTYLWTLLENSAHMLKISYESFVFWLMFLGEWRTTPISMTYTVQICPGNFLLHDVFRNKMQGHLALQPFKLNPKIIEEMS